MTERLQKILSTRGVASRRKAEEMIAAGRVSVNGNIAKLGDSADAELDTILVDGKALPSQQDRVYILLNKPRGYVTTLSDEKGRKTVVAAGGVAANSTLRAALQNLCDKNGLKLCLPPLKLCGDNGSMIAAQAYYEFLAGNTSDSSQNCYATMPAEENVSAWTL
jgi:hypothetical protein